MKVASSVRDRIAEEKKVEIACSLQKKSTGLKIGIAILSIGFLVLIILSGTFVSENNNIMTAKDLRESLLTRVLYISDRIDYEPWRNWIDYNGIGNPSFKDSKVSYIRKESREENINITRALTRTSETVEVIKDEYETALKKLVITATNFASSCNNKTYEDYMPGLEYALYNYTDPFDRIVKDFDEATQKNDAYMQKKMEYTKMELTERLGTKVCEPDTANTMTECNNLCEEINKLVLTAPESITSSIYLNDKCHRSAITKCGMWIWQWGGKLTETHETPKLTTDDNEVITFADPINAESSSTGWGMGPDLAIDSKPDTFSHSKEGENDPWLEVTFAKTSVSGIKLTNRDGNGDRLKDILVRAGESAENSVVGRFDGPGRNAEIYHIKFLDGPVIADRIRIQIDGKGTLQIAEVKVITVPPVATTTTSKPIQLQQENNNQTQEYWDLSPIEPKWTEFEKLGKIVGNNSWFTHRDPVKALDGFTKPKTKGYCFLFSGLNEMASLRLHSSGSNSHFIYSNPSNCPYSGRLLDMLERLFIPTMKSKTRNLTMTTTAIKAKSRVACPQNNIIYMDDNVEGQYFHPLFPPFRSSRWQIGHKKCEKYCERVKGGGCKSKTAVQRLQCYVGSKTASSWQDCKKECESVKECVSWSIFTPKLDDSDEMYCKLMTSAFKTVSHKSGGHTVKSGLYSCPTSNYQTRNYIPYHSYSDKILYMPCYTITHYKKIVGSIIETISGLEVKTPSSCFHKCSEKTDCQMWTHIKKGDDKFTCQLFQNGTSLIEENNEIMSGGRPCPKLCENDIFYAAVDGEKNHGNVASPEACRKLCKSVLCFFWSYNGDTKNCVMKEMRKPLTAKKTIAGSMSGFVNCVEITSKTPCPAKGLSFDRPYDLRIVDDVADWVACSKKCREHHFCNFWSWLQLQNTGGCFLFRTDDGRKIKVGKFNIISGSRLCDKSKENFGYPLIKTPFFPYYSTNHQCGNLGMKYDPVGGGWWDFSSRRSWRDCRDDCYANQECKYWNALTDDAKTDKSRFFCESKKTFSKQVFYSDYSEYSPNPSIISISGNKEECDIGTVEYALKYYSDYQAFFIGYGCYFEHCVYHGLLYIYNDMIPNIQTPEICIKKCHNRCSGINLPADAITFAVETKACFCICKKEDVFKFFPADALDDGDPSQFQISKFLTYRYA